MSSACPPYGSMTEFEDVVERAETGGGDGLGRGGAAAASGTVILGFGLGLRLRWTGGEDEAVAAATTVSTGRPLCLREDRLGGSAGVPAGGPGRNFFRLFGSAGGADESPAGGAAAGGMDEDATRRVSLVGGATSSSSRSSGARFLPFRTGGTCKLVRVVPREVGLVVVRLRVIGARDDRISPLPFGGEEDTSILRRRLFPRRARMLSSSLGESVDGGSSGFLEDGVEGREGKEGVFSRGGGVGRFSRGRTEDAGGWAACATKTVSGQVKRMRRPGRDMCAPLSR